MTDLFGGAAPYYAQYRPGYGDAAIDHLATTFGRDSRVLDLGCGPGTVAIPLARRIRAVTAVDPDEEMLAEGRRLAAGTPNIRWLRGDSTMLRELPAFDHIVMAGRFTGWTAVRCWPNWPSCSRRTASWRSSAPGARSTRSPGSRWRGGCARSSAPTLSRPPTPSRPPASTTTTCWPPRRSPTCTRPCTSSAWPTTSTP
ncbi:class I SAM-dependent methyltransferase [Nonomuraea sp. H19]|uniref:class I SAM-dependent methyltransferase n=1 Tax=Nonomuraea sp. H19 TaxID=3452206 RepID=UPI003F893E9B